MAPLIVLIVSTLVLRLAGAAGIRCLASWRDATRVGLAVMFTFTGSTHFTALKHDYAAMIPPPFAGQLWVVYVTGLLEIAGAVGLLVPTTRRLAGIGLCLLLLCLFPANIHAALSAINFRGQPPTDIWFRTLLQIVFLAATWWSSVLARRHSGVTRLQPVA
jgi:uncharacterized membrane protein